MACPVTEGVPSFQPFFNNDLLIVIKDPVAAAYDHGPMPPPPRDGGLFNSGTSVVS
jgi:hypothetical protein